MSDEERIERQMIRPDYGDRLIESRRIALWQQSHQYRERLAMDALHGWEKQPHPWTNVEKAALAVLVLTCAIAAGATAAIVASWWNL